MGSFIDQTCVDGCADKTDTKFGLLEKLNTFWFYVGLNPHNDKILIVGYYFYGKLNISLFKITLLSFYILKYRRKSLFLWTFYCHLSEPMLLVALSNCSHSDYLRVNLFKVWKWDIERNSGNLSIKWTVNTSIYVIFICQLWLLVINEMKPPYLFIRN